MPNKPVDFVISADGNLYSVSFSVHGPQKEIVRACKRILKPSQFNKFVKTLAKLQRHPE
jgi:hypothetical protein